MYAVLKTGGKQYKVAQNDVIIVEKLAAEAGTSIEIDEILMIDNDGVSTVGAPLIEGARVAAEVLEQKRAKKITVFKKKRRQNSIFHSILIFPIFMLKRNNVEEEHN